MQAYELEINGNKESVEADPGMPLLWILRDLLQMTGTKYGCGKGLCGACTVHLDGKPVRSCSLPVSAVKGEILTIEGLATDGLHPVQQAWIEEQTPQCGFCQSGQIMSAVALLKQNSDPSETEIKSFMSGNICRCGTYPRIIKSIQNAARKTV